MAKHPKKKNELQPKDEADEEMYMAIEKAKKWKRK